MSPSLAEVPERDPAGNPIPAEFAYDIHGNDYGDPHEGSPSAVEPQPLSRP